MRAMPLVTSLVACVAAVSSSLCVAQTKARDASPLDQAAFLRPDDSAAWRSIGWRADLASAVLEASKARRPILLWAMNGHPLGCT